VIRDTGLHVYPAPVRAESLPPQRPAPRASEGPDACTVVAFATAAEAARSDGQRFVAPPGRAPAAAAEYLGASACPRAGTRRLRSTPELHDSLRWV